MAQDNITKLQNYIKRLASSAKEARELISQLVLIDWNAVYPANQNNVMFAELVNELDTGPFVNVIADTHQSVDEPVGNELDIRIWDGGPIATTTSSPRQETEPLTQKPRRIKPVRPKEPKPKYWEVKQRQLEAKEARLAKSPRVKALQAMPYAEYLKTAEWQKTRRRALASAGVKCQMCSATDKPLNVHHNTYERLGYERPSDLIVLCEPCHAKHHDKQPKGVI